MCRTTDYHGFRSNERGRLKIKAFFIRFSGLKTYKPMPELLTLLYLPRINETALEIDGSKIRPDLPAFVTLHRVVTAKTEDGEAIYGSRERVRASEGVGFEVYLRDEKVLKGIFRKAEDEEWKLECKCALEREMVGVDVAATEVCVAVEGHVEMSEKVELVVKKRKSRMGLGKLEEIPEEREVDVESDGECCCLCDEPNGESNGKDLEEPCDEDCDEIDVDGVRWAVDVGIWVVCFGVGYLVSKASAKSLRRVRKF